MDMVTPPLQAQATVVAVEGKVLVRSADGQLRAVKVGDTLHEGETIITASGAHVELASPTGQHFDVGPNQSIALQLDETAPRTPADNTPQPASNEAERVIQALNQPGEIDNSLEDPGAGLAGGGTAEGHTFVRLDRISESTTSLGFQFVTQRGEVDIPVLRGGSEPNQAQFLTQNGPGTILDNDQPSITSVEPGAPGVGDDAVVEGNNLVYTVSLSEAPLRPATYPYSLGGGSASPSDYTTPPTFSDGVVLNPDGTLTVPAGVTSFTVTVPTVDDPLVEPTETVPLTIGGVTGTATIVDNDAAPTLSINDVTVNEAAGTATFTVSLSAPSGLAVTVDFATADGTATAGADYSASSGSLSFAPGVTSQTITVPILNDNTYEGSENFNVNLTNAVNATVADPQGVGTINDDGTGPVPPGVTPDDDRPTLTVSSPTVSEADGYAVFTVSLSNPSVQATTVGLSLADGTASTPADYGSALEVSTDAGATWTPATSATFAPGATSVLVRAPVVDDAIDELDETFSLSATTTAGTTVNPSASGTATIVDNDAAPTLSINDVTVNEAAGTATFTVSLSAPSGLAVTVDFATADGTATAGADYSASSGSLSFAPGVTSQTITVPILNDNTYEGSENFNVNLTNAVNATVADPQGVGTINDDGTGPVPPGVTPDDDRPTLTVSSPTVSEADGYAVFTVSLSNPSVQATTVGLSLADGTASTPADYGSALEVSTDAGATWTPATSATFAPGATSVLVRAPVVDDAIDELDETFSLSATTTAGTTVNPSASGTATIVDNDAAPTLSINDVTVNEAAGTATFTVSLSAPSGLAVTVDFATADGTATAGADYSASSGSLSFAPGVTSQTITVPILNDNTYEGSENFNVNLTNAVNATVADPQGVGTINDDGTGPVPPGVTPDDDRPTLTVSSPTVSEADGYAVFTVSLSNPSVQATTVGLSLADGTASTPADYGSALEVFTDAGATWTPATSATFAPGATSVLVRAPVVDDAIDELDETFSLSATTTAGTTVNPSASGTATIVDNDAAPTLSINDVTVNEAAGTATFTVSLSAPSGLAVTVDFATADGTATAGADYSASSGSLSFAPGVTSQTITVPILNDNTYEGSENFNVNLTNAVNATVADPQGVGTINDDGTGPVPPGVTPDDDRPTLTVSSPTVSEADGYAVFTVSLSNPSVQATTVGLSLADGTASTPADYGSALEVSTDAGATWTPATSATFAPGATSVLVRAPVVDDAIDELDETFSLSATTTAGTTVNPSASGTATIVDNDAAPTLSINDVTVNEAAGTATFTVSLSAPSGLAVTVDFATADGTATAGADYSASSGSLSFAPGVTSQTITVPILNDNTYEGSENFNVNLTNAVNATVADPQGVGTINDDGTGPVPPGVTPDDDRPTLTVSSPTVSEADGYAVFTVSLSNPSVQATTVGLSLADGTASTPADYGSALEVSTDAGATWTPATSATFAPGATSVLVRAPVVDDAIDELDETFSLSATTTAGTTVNPSASGTATIVDNDAAPTLSINDVTVNEAAGTATFTVSLSAPSGLAVTVDFATADGTATAGADYSASSGSLSFAPGVTSQTITVPILNDNTYEGSENFNVNLTNAVNATVADRQGVGTINDDGTGPVPPGVTPDDDRPTLTVSSPTVSEADGYAVFTVSLSNPSVQATTVGLSLADGTASTPADYGSALEVSTDAGATWTPATSATFAPGATSVLVRAPVVNDAIDELDETFSLSATTTAGTTVQPQCQRHCHHRRQRRRADPVHQRRHGQ